MPNFIFIPRIAVNNIPRILIAAFWANGFEVGADGVADFVSQVNSGAGGPQGQVLPVGSFGLTFDHLESPSTAMIQYVIKWHGASSSDAGELADQLNLAEGLCAENFPELTAAVGIPFCPDVQRLDF